MCTLTVLPTTHGMRIGFNRDESPDRLAADPPQLIEIGGRRSLAPRDPVGGGTWLAVNDAGVVFALLNATEIRGSQPIGRISRGRIIPHFLDVDSADAATKQVMDRIEFMDYSPFRFVVVDSVRLISWLWNGRKYEVQERSLDSGPMMFASSGLGDALADAVRRPIFEELFGDAKNRSSAMQDAFHRHKTPGWEHLSVCMKRPTAETVSYSSIDVNESVISFIYHPAAPDCEAAQYLTQLELARSV
jgi:uncharacterized protein with NRDE domain